MEVEELQKFPAAMALTRALMFVNGGKLELLYVAQDERPGLYLWWGRF